MRPNKTVVVDGMTWSVISRNERAVSIAGRHFFACRCRPSSPWTVHEHDQDILVSGSANPLRVYQEHQNTADLTGFVNDVMMGADTPWLPFDQHRAQQKARTSAVRILDGNEIVPETRELRPYQKQLIEEMRDAISRRGQGSPDIITADGRALEFK